jgi:hypothetical protein
VLKILDIESSGSDISSDKNWTFTTLEHGKSLVTFLLGLVSVNSDAVPLLIPKASADILTMYKKKGKLDIPDVLFVDKHNGSLQCTSRFGLGSKTPDIDQKLGKCIHLVAVFHHRHFLNNVCIGLEFKTSDLDLDVK